jgi:threonine/homoserine/homoserine lactone efflux protein
MTRMTSNPGGEDMPGEYSPNGKRLVFARCDRTATPFGRQVIKTNGAHLRGVARARASLRTRCAPVKEAIGQVLPFGIGVALSPLPIVAVVLMLATERARSNGPAFVLGWVLGLALAGALVLLASSGGSASDAGAPATWVSWLKFVLGVAALLLGVKQFRDRPRGGAAAELPKWMRTVDRFTPRRAAAIAVALSAINPKNLLLTVGAAATIAQAGITAGQQAIALAVFIAIATLGVGAPVAIYFALGDRSAALLEELRDWMARNNNTIMAVLLVVIGAKLLGDGIAGL